MSENRTTWPTGVDLATDSWTLDGLWRNRVLDPPSCAERLGRLLHGLAALDPTLAEWYDEDDERLALDPQSLLELLQRCRGDDDPHGEYGSVVGLYNGPVDENRSALVKMVCGTRVKPLRDTIQLELPRPAGAPDLYRTEQMIALFDLVIDTWQPHWCRVQSRSLERATEQKFGLNVLASWMVYLDREVYTRTAELPDGVRAIDRESGELLVLADTPEHLRLPTIDALRADITFTDDWEDLA